MKWIAVFYDSRCGLCTTLKEWIRRQQPLIRVRLVPRDSKEAEQLVGRAVAESEDLMVLASTGEVWRGNHAWLMVLWSLKEYRSMSYQLATPLLLPLARQAFAALSENRGKVATWFALRSESELSARLANVALPGCPIPRT